MAVNVAAHSAADDRVPAGRSPAPCSASPSVAAPAIARRDWIAVALIILAATAPFLGKAFHIDDALYLAVARQILHEPWDPYGALVLWEEEPEPLFDADFNPPLWNYLMAGVLAVTGEPAPIVTRVDTVGQRFPTYTATSSRLPEIALHLLESVFVALAIIALYLLSRRWTRWPVTATALVALSPAMLPGQNVMLEGPVMASWLWCVWCHLRGIDTGNVRWIWLASLVAAAAVMTKYTSGLVIVVLVGYSIYRRHWRGLYLVCVPGVALGLWCVHNWVVYERAHALVIFSRVQTSERAGSGVSLVESWSRLLATVRVIGATTALALPTVVAIFRRFGTWGVLGITAFSFVLALPGYWDMQDRLADRGQKFPESLPAHLLAFGTLGSCVLVGLALGSIGAAPRSTSLPRSREEILLWLWVVAVGAFGILATPFLAVRHLLPGIPPLVWLVLIRFERATCGVNGVRDTEPAGRNSLQSHDSRLVRGTLGAAVVLSTLCGYLVAKADYDFAGWYRHVAMSVGSRTVAAGRDLGKDVWFTGHWGWAYYAERAGMKPYGPGETQMREGDFLLMPLIQTWQLPPKELYPYLHGLMPTIKPTPRTPQTGLAPIDRLLDYSLGSVRTISNEVHLYGSGTMSVPWRFSRKPLDDFGVIEVTSEEKSPRPRPLR